MKNLLIDVRELGDEPAGIGRFIRSLITAMRTTRPNEIMVFVNDREDKYFGDEVEYLHIPYSGMRWHFEVKKRIEKISQNVIYLSARSLIVPSLTKVSTVLVVHDLIARLYPDLLKIKSVMLDKIFLPLALVKTSAIVAVSNSTANDVIRLFPKIKNKVYSITEAADSIFSPRPYNNGIINKYNLPANYILTVGTIEPRKNHLVLLKAYSRLPRDIQNKYGLVIVGKKGWKCEHILKSITVMQQKYNIKYLNYIENEDLYTLYAMSSLFVYPSIYEGFGLPVLEAMQSGVPVITSKSSSMPEVGGDAVEYIDPHDYSSLSSTISRVLNNQELYNALRVKGIERAKMFSWDEAAIKMWTVIDMVYAATLEDPGQREPL